MQCPDVFKYCLVRKEDVNGKFYDRAKIMEVIYDQDEILVKVFLLDIGHLETVSIDQVYDIPDELVERFPFQVWKTH